VLEEAKAILVFPLGSTITHPARWDCNGRAMPNLQNLILELDFATFERKVEER
jgi:hypothetical protein